MMRKLIAMALMGGLVALSFAGCGDGFDSDEAATECDAKRSSLALKDCMDDVTYSACLTCFEECGDGCATIDTACPTQFTCPEE